MFVVFALNNHGDCQKKLYNIGQHGISVNSQKPVSSLINFL